jgi:hypothetical protein
MMVAYLNLTIDRELNGLKVGSCVNKVGSAANSDRYPPHQRWAEAFVSDAVGKRGGLDSETKVGEEEVDLRDELGGKEGHGRHVQCNGGSAGLAGLHATKKLKFVENHPDAHNYVVKSKYPVGLVGLLISGDALKKMLENEGYVHIRKQQEPGSTMISTRPTTRPAYHEQDPSTRKQQEPREPGTMSLSNRPTKKGQDRSTRNPGSTNRNEDQRRQRRSEEVPRGQDA